MAIELIILCGRADQNIFINRKLCGQGSLHQQQDGVLSKNFLSCNGLKFDFSYGMSMT